MSKNYGNVLSKEFTCKQGAVRAVRFNGKTIVIVFIHFFFLKHTL